MCMVVCLVCRSVSREKFDFIMLSRAFVDPKKPSKLYLPIAVWPFTLLNCYRYSTVRWQAACDSCNFAEGQNRLGCAMGFWQFVTTREIQSVKLLLLAIMTNFDRSP